MQIKRTTNCFKLKLQVQIRNSSKVIATWPKNIILMSTKAPIKNTSSEYQRLTIVLKILKDAWNTTTKSNWEPSNATLLRKRNFLGKGLKKDPKLGKNKIQSSKQLSKKWTLKECSINSCIDRTGRLPRRCRSNSCNQSGSNASPRETKLATNSWWSIATESRSTTQ